MCEKIVASSWCRLFTITTQNKDFKEWLLTPQLQLRTTCVSLSSISRQDEKTVQGAKRSSLDDERLLTCSPSFVSDYNGHQT